MAAADEEMIYAGGLLTFGGNAMGTMQAVALEFVGIADDITAEEFGGEVWDQVYLREEWICVAMIANWDPTALSAYFSNISSGRVTYTGSTTYGSLRSGDAGVLELTPRDAARPSFKLWNAIPQLARATLRFGGDQPLTVETSWLGIRDSSDRVVSV